MSQLALCPLPPKEPLTKVRLTTAVPAWLSPVVARDVTAFIAAHVSSDKDVSAHVQAGGTSIIFRYSKGERKVLRRRKSIPVSLWAERHRILEMSSIPGKWKNLFTPYLTGIMDAAGTPGVETVIICKSPQTGGSEAGHNLVGWCIDRSPGPVMYVFPDEITARENAKDRIIPMISGSPRLRDYMTGLGDDASSLRINLAHMPIYLGWSGSVSRLGNKPIRTLILDELDKYKNPKNEATSEILAEKRTTTWRSRRHILKISTPTTEDGPIWIAFTQEAGARFDYYVRCPHCNMAQLMQFERIDWPGKDVDSAAKDGGKPRSASAVGTAFPASESSSRTGRAGERHIADSEPLAETVLTRRLATYPCEHCGVVWDDGDRDRAVRRGEWRERSSGLDLTAHLLAHRPVKVGFHIPAWLSYFVSLSEVAAAALKYKQSGNMDDLKNLQNQYKAEPWKVEYAERKESQILALCDDRPRGNIPGPLPERPSSPRVSCLLATADTHKNRFNYVIRAYAFGDVGTSWLVQCGEVETFAEMNRLFWDSVYTDPAGTEYAVRACMIDAMGGRNNEVYEWAAQNRGRIFPWQGVQTMTQPYTAVPREYFIDLRGRKVIIPGGINLWRCDTTYFKNDLAYRLGIHPDDPGAFHLHSDLDRLGKVGQLEEYARQMCAEVLDDAKMVWVNPADKPNHYYDCEVMQRALSLMLNVRHMRPPQAAAKTKTPTRQQTTRQHTTPNVGNMLSNFRR